MKMEKKTKKKLLQNWTKNTRSTKMEQGKQFSVKEPR